MRSAIGACLLLAVALIVSGCNASSVAPAPKGSHMASVVLKGNSFALVDGQYSSGAVATGSFSDTLNTTGWGVLYINTNSAYTDEQQMYAAGMLEGALTADRIVQMSQNMNNYLFNTPQPNPSSKIQNFFMDQANYVNNQINANPNDPLWIGINFVQQQFNGLMAGYAQSNTGQKSPLPTLAFQILNGVGDLLDLIPALDMEMRHDWYHLPKHRAMELINSRSLCSALIKVNGNLTSLMASHSSWFTFSAMNRIFKHYYFDLQSKLVSAKGLSFSSYPGFLESLDDFYIMSNGLTMIQTTNNIFNTTLYNLVKPNSLFAWQRVRLANLFANSGSEWYNWVKQNNSGTYNNQYMVIDYKLFTPGQGLRPNTLWVSEQIPGMFVGADLTRELERGYFPSYNVPYFLDIYEASGYGEMAAVVGTNVDYQLAPRANIFRRDSGTVIDHPTLEHIMRYNNYKTDPYSGGDPWNAVCSRGDLAGEGSPDGCYDTKYTDEKLSASGQSYALNGPTTENGLPAFKWTGAWSRYPHVGLPEVFNFTFVKMDAMWGSSLTEA